MRDGKGVLIMYQGFMLSQGEECGDVGVNGNKNVKGTIDHQLQKRGALARVAAISRR